MDKRITIIFRGDFLGKGVRKTRLKTKGKVEKYHKIYVDIPFEVFHNMVQLYHIMEQEDIL